MLFTLYQEAWLQNRTITFWTFNVYYVPTLASVVVLKTFLVKQKSICGNPTIEALVLFQGVSAQVLNVMVYARTVVCSAILFILYFYYVNFGIPIPMPVFLLFAILILDLKLLELCPCTIRHIFSKHQHFIFRSIASFRA